MRRLVWLCVPLLLFAALTASASRRRAINPGDSRCVVGVGARDVLVRSIALDSMNIYFVAENGAGLYRVAKSGGAPTELAVFPGRNVFDIAVDDTEVFVVSVLARSSELAPSGAIDAVPKAGGTPRTLASGIANPVHVAADGTHVYWVSAGAVRVTIDGVEILSEGRIERVRKDGSGRGALAEGLSSPSTLLLDATSVFFDELGAAPGNPRSGIRRVAKTGGPVMDVADGYLAVELAQTETEVVFHGEKKDPRARGIFAVSRNDGSVRTVLTDDAIFAGPRVAGGHIYYIRLDENNDPALMKVPLSGGAPQQLRAPNLLETSLEVDDCIVYYGTANAQLAKASR